MLSLHFSLAERPSDTWLYSLLAAARAKAKFANADAAEFYRRALDAARSLPTLARADVGQAWEALGDVLELSGDYGDARLAYKEARSAMRGDAGALAEIYLKEGRLRENEGTTQRPSAGTRAACEQSESLESDRQTIHRLRLSLGYAAARFRQGASRDCVEWCEEIVRDAQAAGALAELAHAYYLLHLGYTSIGSAGTGEGPRSRPPDL